MAGEEDCIELEKHMRKESKRQIKLCIGNFKKLETVVAKYIFKKYIEKDDARYNDKDFDVSNDTDDIDDLDDLGDMDNESENYSDNDSNNSENYDDNETPEIITKSQKKNTGLYSKRVYNKVQFKQYIDKIFIKSRTGIITQGEILTDELKDIADANEKLDEMKAEALEKHQTVNCSMRFARSTVKSFPDMMRCGFIIKSKNKYHRCGNKVLSDDCEYCHIHEHIPNIYYDKYNTLIEGVN